MDHGNFETFAARKAFEVSYALFRLSTKIKNGNFAAYVESHATSLLSAAALEDYKGAHRALVAIDYFMKLGAEIGAISYENSNIITRETSGLYSAIADFNNQAKTTEIDIQDIFSETRGQKKKQAKHDKKEKEEIRVNIDNSENEIEIGKNNDMTGESGNQAIGADHSAKTRQSAILDIIRQSNVCRLKDIMRDIHEFFPDISERTVRYDLQRLVEEGTVERTGSGGPATFYQIKGESDSNYMGRKMEVGEVEVGEI